MWGLGYWNPLLHNGNFIAPLLFWWNGFQEYLRWITLPEHDGSEHGPNLLIAPVFAEDVGRVEVAWEMPEVDGTCRDGFTCIVIRQGLVSLPQRGVWNRGTSDY